MKFKRLNFLDKPIRLFRTHYFSIELIYEYDFGGPDFTGVDLPDISGFTALADVEMTVTDDTANSLYLIKIKGRFEKLNDANILLTIPIPVPAPSGNSFVEDFVPVKVLAEYFWSKNPIRIYLDGFPADVVNLYAESRYNTGKYVKVAAIQVNAFIFDQNGYYVELDKFLDAFLEQDAYKDFKAFYNQDAQEQGFYEYSIRRFHIENKHSLIANATGNEPYNSFIVIQGMRDKEQAFREKDFWGLPDEVASWRPQTFVQQIGNFDNVALPFSILDVENKLSIETPMDENDTPGTLSFYPHAGESVLAVVHTDLYIFLMVTDQGGTKIYFTEREFIYFRACHYFEGIFASHLLATDQAPYINHKPTLWLFFISSYGEPTVLKFVAPIFDSLTAEGIFKIKVNRPFQDEIWQWEVVCNRFGSGVAGILKNVLTEERYLAVIDTAATVSINMDHVFTPPRPITGFAGFIDGNTFWLGVDGAGIFRTTNAGATVIECTNINADILLGNVFFFYREIDKDIILIWAGETVHQAVANIDLDSFGGLVPLSGSGGYFNDIAILDNLIIHYILDRPKYYLVDNTVPLGSNESEINYFEAREFQRLLVSKENKVTILGWNSGEAWVLQKAYHPSSESEFVKGLTSPYLAYNKWLNAAEENRYSLSFKNTLGIRSLTYQFDGRYLRNKRYLYFKTTAGTYELLFLKGVGEESMSSKRQMSSRYTDVDSDLTAGEAFTSWITEGLNTLAVSSGFISKNEFKYFLRELLLSKEFYLVEGPDYVPVNCVVEKPDPISDDPQLYTLKLVLTKSFEMI